MKTAENTWWDMTLLRLKANFRELLEKRESKLEGEETSLAVNYYAATRGRGGARGSINDQASK